MKRLNIIPLAVLAVLAVTPLTSAAAQEPPPVKVGDRVRVSHDCTFVGTRKRCQEDRGTLDAVKADSIVLSAEKDQSRMVILIASVTRLRVVRGQKSHWAAGVGIGFLTGFTTGAVLAAQEPGGCSESQGCTIPFGLFFGAGGALIGGVIGALIKSDRWEEVSLDQLRVSFAPQRDGRFALGFSVAF